MTDKSNKKGKFIVFEGIDGSGKSTQVRLLAKKLETIGRRVKVTAEPTEFESGKALRRVLSGKEKKSEYELACMFVADRISHNTEKDGIIQLTEDGIDVICDRYYYSTLAYQGQAAGYDRVKSMNTNEPLIKHPDICFYLDLSPEESLARIAKRHGEVEIYENAEKLKSVREAFLSVISDLRTDGDMVHIIDASRDPNTVAEDIFRIIEKIY